MHKIYNIFSPVIVEKFPLHNKIKKDLLKLIGESKDTPYKNVTLTMYDDLAKTDWPLSSNFKKRKWVNKYGQDICNFLSELAIILGYTKIEVSRLWYQQYKKNQTHGWHQHARNYSGVYYLEYPENTEPTQFLFTEDLHKTFSVKVKEGDMILFPSYIIHRSPPLQTDKRKTIISWNLDFLNIHPDLVYDRETHYVEEIPEKPDSN